MAKKTYAAYGYIEYDLMLDIGGKKANAHFEGGSISAHGIHPATYETESAVIQYKIEQMKSFKTGRIKLIKTTEESAPAPAPAEPEKATETAAKEIAVNCLEDAVEYLKANCGLKATKLTSQAAVDKAAADNGLKFTYA